MSTNLGFIYATQCCIRATEIDMVKKDCYGRLNKVFPLNDTGYREVTLECLECPDKVPCLKDALATKEGIEVRARVLEKTPARGLFEKIKRWSDRKALSRMVKSVKKE